MGGAVTLHPQGSPVEAQAGGTSDQRGARRWTRRAGETGDTGSEGRMQAEEAVARARAAFATWSALGPAGRGPYLRALRAAVVREADRICDVVCGESGKLRADVMVAEALHAASHADWCARH